MLIIYKFKSVRENDQKGCCISHHKSFCNADEVHGSVPSLGARAEPVAYVSFSRLSTGDFKDPLEAIMKDSLGRGWQCFLPLFPRLLLQLFFEGQLTF